MFIKNAKRLISSDVVRVYATHIHFIQRRQNRWNKSGLKSGVLILETTKI